MEGAQLDGMCNQRAECTNLVLGLHAPDQRLEHLGQDIMRESRVRHEAGHGEGPRGRDAGAL